VMTCGDAGVRFHQGRIVVPNAPALNPVHITIEAVLVWHGPNGLLQRILEKSTSTSGARALYALAIRDDGRVQFELSTVVGDFALVGSSPIPQSQVVHIAATYDGTALRVYRNGQLDKMAPATGFINPQTAEPLGIGNQVTRDRPFNGELDEVAIYATALAAERIASRYSANLLRVVPLHVRPPPAALAPGFLTSTSPVQLGVPVPEGELFDASQTALRDSHKNPVLHQTKALGLWRKLSDATPPTVVRSIKWLQVAFSAEHDQAAYMLHYGGCAVTTAGPSPIVVQCSKNNAAAPCTTKSPDRVIVDTGALRFQVNRAFPKLIDRAWVGSRQVIGASTNQGLYLETTTGVYRAGSDANATLEVEEAGPTQVTLKATGRYVNASGQGINQWVVRIKAYAGKRHVRVFHTIVFDQDSSIRYPDIGIELPLRHDTGRSVSFARGTKYEVAADLAVPVNYDLPASVLRFPQAELNTHARLFMNQDTHDHYAVVESNGVPVMLNGQPATGERSGHWFGLRGARFAVTAAVRWLWQNHPTGLEWETPGIMRLHLWSLKGTPGPVRVLDFTPEPYLRSRGTIPDPAGPGRVDIFKTDIAVVCNRRHEYPEAVCLDCDGNPATPKTCGCMHATGIGVSKTHEITFEFSRPTPSSQKTMAETAYLLQKPVLVQADPGRLRSSLAMGKLHPADPAGFPEIDGRPTCLSNAECAFGKRRCQDGGCENILDVVIDRYFLEQANDRVDPLSYDVRPAMLPPAAVEPWGDSYGAFDFGDTLHQGKDAHRYWAHMFYVEPSVWWTLYARSGDRRLIELGEANARHHMDVDVTHVAFERRKNPCSTDEGPENPIVTIPAGAWNGDDAGAIHWANTHASLNVTNHFASYLTAYYYQTGYERAKDVAQEITRAIEGQNLSDLILGTGDRATGAALWAVADLYALLGSNSSAPGPLHAVARSLASKLADDTLGAHPEFSCEQPGTEDLALGYDDVPVDFTLAYTFPAAEAYLVVEDDPSLAQPVANWLRNQAKFIAANNMHQFQSTYFNQWSGMAHAYHQTGDASLLRAPAADLDRVKQFGFEEIASGVVDRVYWMRNLGYLMDALAAAGAVTPQGDLESTTGEIQFRPEDGALHLKVMVRHTVGYDNTTLDATAKLVLYGPGGAVLASRPHPATPCPASSKDVRWFNERGWIETFDLPGNASGVHRLRVESETGGYPRFVMTLLETNSSSVMLSGGSEDGLSPGNRYPRERRYWVHVPSSTGSFAFSFWPETFCHELVVRVFDPVNTSVPLQYAGQTFLNGVDVGTLPVCPSAPTMPRIVNAQVGSFAGQIWSVDLGPPYERYAQGTSVRRASARETRTFTVSGIPRYFALSQEGAFAPQSLWPAVLLAPLPGQANGTLTFRWHAEAGADDYRLTITGPTSVTHTVGKEAATCRYGAGLCSVSLDTVFQPGSYQWTVQTLSDVPGESPATSAAMSFTVPQ
jgi:Concanavalin A-like lectin/glucanases superfamily/YetA-like protein